MDVLVVVICHLHAGPSHRKTRTLNRAFESLTSGPNPFKHELYFKTNAYNLELILTIGCKINGSDELGRSDRPERASAVDRWILIQRPTISAFETHARPCHCESLPSGPTCQRECVREPCRAGCAGPTGSVCG